MANYHILNETYLKINDKLNLLINDDNWVKIINKKNERKRYFNIKYDL